VRISIERMGGMNESDGAALTLVCDAERDELVVELMERLGL
jgi:hypothetical protein